MLRSRTTAVTKSVTDETDGARAERRRGRDEQRGVFAMLRTLEGLSGICFKPSRASTCAELSLLRYWKRRNRLNPFWYGIRYVFHVFAVGAQIVM